MDGVHERKAVGGLHDAEHELPGNAAHLLVHAKSTDVILDGALAVDPHGGQIVEHHREVPIHQRPDLSRQLDLDPIGMVHQRVHGPQQMLMGHDLGHGRHGHGLQPAQAAEFAGGVAQPVEHHGAHECLDIEPALAGAQGAPEGTVEAKLRPQRMQREHIPESPGRRMGDLELCRLIAPGRTTEPPDQRVEIAVFHAIDAPEIGDDPVPRFASLVAVGLDHLQIAPPTAFVDAHEPTYRICRESQPCNANDKCGV